MFSKLITIYEYQLAKALAEPVEYMLNPIAAEPVESVVLSGGNPVKIFTDESGKRSKGFAFIQYTCQDDAVVLPNLTLRNWSLHFLWFTSCSLFTVSWELLIGIFGKHLLQPLLFHASFRTPNLKARLNTFREEFRAVWRNYSEMGFVLPSWVHFCVSKLLHDAGLPKGVLNMISIYGLTDGATFASHMDVDKADFFSSYSTRSTITGKIVSELAGRSNLKPVTLELGGKSPFIVCEDADIDKAVETSHFALFFNQVGIYELKAGYYGELDEECCKDSLGMICAWRLVFGKCSTH
ncbi:hypothetical protein C5167_046604 [Papaver somniferum]|uniref:Aldehyde dehydrogenase domain-containing protein n=1 Tax=Papaver somniferum TaxID=3469 RepID=A0A4Y7LGY9_PAPSO|nr:hypothetical protein C5167_046604 [Papaver somniferum]